VDGLPLRLTARQWATVDATMDNLASNAAPAVRTIDRRAGSGKPAGSRFPGSARGRNGRSTTRSSRSSCPASNGSWPLDNSLGSTRYTPISVIRRACDSAGAPSVQSDGSCHRRTAAQRSSSPPSSISRRPTRSCAAGRSAGALGSGQPYVALSEHRATASYG
jgi:hypothetical protein